MCIFERIRAFNDSAGLLSGPNGVYNSFRESAFQIEEALEGFDLQDIASRTGYRGDTLTAAYLSRYILGERAKTANIDRVDAIDKACDAIVFAVGSLLKLDLSTEQINDILNIVMDANEQKLESKKKDSEGKLLKDENFVPPEARIRDYLYS